MLSVKSLLNPAPPGAQPTNRFPPSPASSSPTTSFADDSSFLDRPIMPKQKIPKDAAVFNTKSQPKGTVNFYPYERLDDASLRQVRKFQVYPLGKIQEYCRHIPYNSGKKDFYVKTGRESFEVFQYVFKVPGEDVEYVVMWDYNVGLVRMTPFFKCCKYPKTTPAKMLNANPGLKEITHSITGGSIMAQGYWMPYHCAKAVCATFCQHIAGALIPIFGPDFPSLCTPVDTPEYSRMVIDPAIVAQATQEAEHFRRMYNSMTMTSSSSAASSSRGRDTSPRRDRQQQQQQHRMLRNPYEEGGRQQHQQQQPHHHHHSHPRHHHSHSHNYTHHHQHHHSNNRMRKPFANNTDSPYGTDTEGDMSPPPMPMPMPAQRSSTTTSAPTPIMGERYLYSPIPPPTIPSFRTHSGWTPANMLPHYEQAPGPSPWLSAVPRLTPSSSTSTNTNTTAAVQPSPPPPPSLPPPPIHHHHPPPLPPARSAYPPQLQPLQLRPPPPQQQQQPYPSPQHPWRRSTGSKRSADHIIESSEYEYDSGTATATTRRSNTAAASPSDVAMEEDDRISLSALSSSSSSADTTTTITLGADKNAALLLMNLSVRDSIGGIGSSGNHKGKTREGRNGGSGNGGGAAAAAAGSISMSSASCSPCDGSFPRIKRIRSNSM